MARSAQQTIPTPFLRRLGFLAESWLPKVAWVAGVAVLIALGSQQWGHRSVCNGIVELKQATVAPETDSRVAEVTVSLYQDVQRGQVVARLNDEEVRAERTVVQAELEQVRAELAAGNTEMRERQATRLSEERRFRGDMESARVAYAERSSTQARDKAEMTRLSSLLERQKQAAASGLLDKVTYEATCVQYDGLKAHVQETETELVELKTQAKAAEERWTAYTAQIAGIQDETALEPLLRAIAVQEARLQEIEVRESACSLRAPISGKVTQILCQAGQAAPRGTPILMITDPAASRVIAYVDERLSTRFEPGEAVEILAARLPRYSAVARIASRGPAVEELPLHLQRNGFPLQWGIPLLVESLPSNHAFLPGETVQVVLAQR